jgi:N6-L-threonylcarbamoyladenine synthase
MPDAPTRPGLGLILGIESSCDETAAAVVRRGTEVLSNVVASQIALHANFGGVVPELASREHLRNIVPVVRAAIAEVAKAHPGLTLRDLDAIAVTRGPGLAGALLVGITYAKALALALGKPLLAINHLEGHIHAVLMDNTTAAGTQDSPILALVVSGGHTHLYLAQQQSAGQGSESSENLWNYRNVGRTVDDAAGEAFDKVAKLLGLGYPGGPWIDALAPLGNPHAVPFTFSPIKPRLHHPAGNAAQLENPKARQTATTDTNFDFSFSGIKTAVLRYTQTHAMQSTMDARHRALAAAPDLKPTPDTIANLRAHGNFDAQTLDLIASFQHSLIGNLLKQTLAAAEHFGARHLLISGGVSANAELRRRFTAQAERRCLTVAFPALSLSTDNAAMIAAAAWSRLLAGDLAPDDLTATPQLRLG